MYKICINKKKSLQFATKEQAERFADDMEKVTGERPKIVTTGKSDRVVSYGMASRITNKGRI